MKRFTALLATACAALLYAAVALVFPHYAAAATLTEVTNFGANPGNLRMHLYVPDNRPTNPAIVLAMHPC
ncbi:esterase, partial [Sphaerisporangium dianthi]